MATFVGTYKHRDHAVTRIADKEPTNHERFETALYGPSDMSQKKSCEPISDADFDQLTAEQHRQDIESGAAAERSRLANEQFADASDRRHRYGKYRDGAGNAPTRDAGTLSPSQRFAAASDRRWASPMGAMKEFRRRLRSE